MSRRFQKISLVLIVAVCVSLVALAAKDLAAPAEAQILITASGSAEITGGDLAQAKENARRAAMRTAVEEGVGYYITSRAQVENFALIHSQVIEQAGGLAVIKQIVKEEQDLSRYRVTLVVAVSPLPLLNIIRQNGILRQWRVMVVIPEIHIRSAAPDPAGETEFIRQFSDAGFKTVDPAAYAAVRRADAEIFKSAAARKKLAKQTGADLMIIGEAFSERAQDASGGMMNGLVGCNARIEAKAIAVDTGEIFYADGQNSVVPTLHTSELVAGKKAIQTAAHELAQKFLLKLVTRLAALSRPTTIVVHGLGTPERAREFEKAVGKLKGVGRVIREEFSPDMLVLEADVSSAATDMLTDRIHTLAFTEFRLQLVAASRHQMRFQAEVK